MGKLTSSQLKAIHAKKGKWQGARYVFIKPIQGGKGVAANYKSQTIVNKRGLPIYRRKEQYIKINGKSYKLKK